MVAVAAFVIAAEKELNMPNITLINCYDTTPVYDDGIQYDFYFLRIINIPEKVLTKIKKTKYNAEALMFLAFGDNSVADQEAENILTAISTEEFNAENAKEYISKIAMEKPETFERVFGCSLVGSDFSDFLTDDELDSNDSLEDVFKRMSTERKEKVIEFLYNDFMTLEIREVDYRNPVWLFDCE